MTHPVDFPQEFPRWELEPGKVLPALWRHVWPRAHAYRAAHDEWRLGQARRSWRQRPELPAKPCALRGLRRSVHLPRPAGKESAVIPSPT